MPVCTRFSCWSSRCPETPQKWDTRLRNEIGINFGNEFPPPIMWSLVFGDCQGLFGENLQHDPKHAKFYLRDKEAKPHKIVREADGEPESIGQVQWWLQATYAHEIKTKWAISDCKQSWTRDIKPMATLCHSPAQGQRHMQPGHMCLSAPKSRAVCDLRLRWPSLTPKMHDVGDRVL